MYSEQGRYVIPIYIPASITLTPLTLRVWGNNLLQRRCDFVVVYKHVASSFKVVRCGSGCSLPGKQAWFVMDKVYLSLSQSAARKPSKRLLSS